MMKTMAEQKAMAAMAAEERPPSSEAATGSAGVVVAGMAAAVEDSVDDGASVDDDEEVVVEISEDCQFIWISGAHTLTEVMVAAAAVKGIERGVIEACDSVPHVDAGI